MKVGYVMSYFIIETPLWDAHQKTLLALMDQYVSLACLIGTPVPFAVLEEKSEEFPEIKIHQENIALLLEQLQLFRNEPHILTIWEELVEFFQLGDFEVFALLAIFGAETWDGLRLGFEVLQHDVSAPTADMIIALFEMVHDTNDLNLRETFAHNRTLRRFFIEETSETQTYYFKQPLQLRPYLRDCLIGGTFGSALLEDCCTLSPVEDETPVFGNFSVYQELMNYGEFAPTRIISAERGEQLWLVGERSIGKKFLAEKLALSIQKEGLYLNLEKVFSYPTESATALVTDLVIHSLLGNYLVCVHNIPKENERKTTSFLEYLHEKIPFFVVCAQEKLAVSEESRLVLNLRDWDTTSTVAFWYYVTEGLPLSPEILFQDMANRYALSPGQIESVVQTAIICGFGEEEITKEHLIYGVKQLKQHVLGEYAQLIESPFSWDDLVLDPPLQQQLEMICTQVRLKDIVGEQWGFFEKLPYGRGISALFHGPPGTGKTMTAQALANNLGLDLFRIDSSQLISKYIGETQKNIAKLFDRAKKINAILFFDEADALFSKRSAVNDANDKHANAETALLLQRFESYDGIVILASNHMNNMDAAFQRRIKFILKFELPNATMREEIWRKCIPTKAQTGKLDFEKLAEEHEFAGSEIKEILLNAAFLAADKGTVLEQSHILQMIRLHYRKKGRPMF